MVQLYDTLKAGYGSKENEEHLKHRGFTRDHQLSNKNEQVYYNPRNNKLLYNVSGTHSLSDVGTDAYLAFGHLKDANRFKEAKSNLEKAKQKYNVDKASISGHSLGGAISEYIAGKNDKVTLLDKGATIGQPTRNNEKSYRTAGDLVSYFASKTKTLKNPNHGLSAWNPLSAHNVDNIKDYKIRV